MRYRGLSRKTAEICDFPTQYEGDFVTLLLFSVSIELEDPEVYLDVVDENLSQTIGNIIAKSYELMVELK